MMALSAPPIVMGGVDTFGKSTTLVGWFGGPDEDPNH